MRPRTTALIAVVLAALAIAGAARAEEFGVAGHRLKIETFRGYCLVPRNDPVGHILYDMTDDASGGTEATLSIQADCAVLEKFWKETSQPVRLQPALAVQLDLANGQASALPLTRAEFLAMKEAALKAETDDVASSSVKQDTAAAIERLKARMPGIKAETAVENSVALGVLDQDAEGIYYGVVQVFDNAGQRYVQAAIGASTLIDSLPVSVVRTDRLADTDQIPDMTAEIKRLLHELVSLNEGGI